MDDIVAGAGHDHGQLIDGGEDFQAFVQEATCRTDHYAHYLAQVDETNAVHATHDICNHNGVLLVKSGGRIDSGTAQRILQHRLLRPLEDQVELTDQLDGERLSHHFHAITQRYPDVARMHESLSFRQEFRQLLFHPTLNARLRQKVTVFQARLPEQFEAGVLGAWLAALLARELGMDKEGVHSAFYAGLVRDLGFLHIVPDTVFKKGVLTAEEWRAIMGHVVVGNLFLSSLSGVSEGVVQAVLEHHERCDGTGYPAGRVGTQLSTLGNIVGMADTLQAVRVKQFQQRGRNFMDARPYLQLNTGKHSNTVGEAMMAILKRSGLKMTCQGGQDMEVTAGRLQDRLVTVQRVIPILRRLTLLTAAVPRPGPRGKSLMLALSNVLSMVTRSGLDREELVDWARNAESEPHPEVLEELNEMELLGNELLWQFKSVQRGFAQLCSERTKDVPEMAGIEHARRELEHLLSG